MKFWTTTLKFWLTITKMKTDCGCAATAAKRGAPSKEGGWKARCGVVFENKRAMKWHQSVCAACDSIKRQNIKERQAKVNNDSIHKAAASKAARLTAQRPEIISQRSANLAKWRKENPEKFSECVKAAQAAAKGRSKAELWVGSYLGDMWRDSQIFCRAANSNKQVDFVCGKIWIEIDGFWHFNETKRVKDLRPSRLKQTLEARQYRDAILKDEALRRGDIMLLRFSVECFYRNGEMKPEWLQCLIAMLQSPKPGIWCHGKLYESPPWAKEGCTILKYPTPSTISCCPVES